MSFCNMGDNQTYTHKYHYLVISESEIRMLDIHAYILVRVIVWYFDKTHKYCKKTLIKYIGHINLPFIIGKCYYLVVDIALQTS